MNESQKIPRIMWMDAARSFAIISIVFCHCVESFYIMDLETWSTLSSFNRLFRLGGFTFGRLGVPIFLFLSGALLLRKKIDNDNDIISFYKHNALPLIITTTIWNILYNLFLALLNFQQVDFGKMISDIFFFTKVDMSNMWYMPMIIGMYIAVPFLALILKKVTLKALLLPMLICFAFSFILPDIKLIGSILQTPISISTRLDLSFLGGAYGLYLLFGYFMCFKPHKPSWIIWLIGAAALFFIVCILQWWAAESGIKYSVWYNSTALLLCGCCIFKVFQSLPEINPNIAKIFKLLSGYSFAIFFLHRPIQMLIVKSGILSNLPLSVSVLFLWILSFGVSLLISYPLSKISLVKKYLLGVRQ